MILSKLRTIVHDRSALRYFPRKYIDSPTLSLLQQSFCMSGNKPDLRNPLINLLDCYLGVTGQSITYLSLSKKSANQLFAGFIGALMCDTFVTASCITRDIYVREFLKILKTMSFDIPNLAYEIDKDIAQMYWRGMRIAPLQREYYHGWRVKSKTGKDGRSLRLAWVWNNLGPDVVRKLHKAATDFSQRYEGKSQGNFIPVLNELFNYMECNCCEITVKHLASPQFTTKFFESFCRDFFESNQKAGNCLETAIKRWNDAIPFLESTLLDSGVLAKPYRNIPYISPKRKTGAESHIAKNKEGVIVKEKLIVDVPLHLTDDEVILLLFKKINKDVGTVLNWAHHQASSIYERCVMNGAKFNHMDFELTTKQIASKYGVKVKRKEKTVDLAYRLGLPTAHSLEPFVYLLIKEHPQITESFLLGLELYDKRGKFVGLEKTDACTYLLGYKKRRGGKRASQKVKLNEKTIVLVNQLIKLTEPLRKYLKAKGDDNYRYLFLSCRRGFCRPAAINKFLVPKAENAGREKRINQFIELAESCDYRDVKELIKRLTPTRFRATIGVQIYLETGSTKTMSEALGHLKYKPELLSHYLPEPILQFFQSRWIRIFQKGIVCEAMKDSPLLLRAGNFKTMDELDMFLTNHVFSFPEDPAEIEPDEKIDGCQVYISVDENVLTALLSLESAVGSTSQAKISAKALYWSKFTSLLITEIEKNTFDSEMNLALEHARNNVDPTLMQNLIYDS